MSQEALRRAPSPRKLATSPAASSASSTSSPRIHASRAPEPFGRGRTLKAPGCEQCYGSQMGLMRKIGFWATLATLLLALFATIYYAGVAVGQMPSSAAHSDQAAVVQVTSPSATSNDPDPGTQQLDVREAWGRPPAGVLVLYNFKDTNPEFYNNLRYFLREGVMPDDGATYLVIVHRDVANTVQLPELPRNARYLYHDSDCDDWGIFGWVLKSQVKIQAFRFFVFLNSSVRGPYLPAYIQSHIHWLNVLLSKLNDDVKLVGPTINCQPTPRGDMVGLRKNPHVQTYTIATDLEGLRVLLARAEIFRCYDSVWDTVYFSEVGLSLAILEAGFNLDCLLARYQGLDWRRPENWSCNRNMNPLLPNAFDGSSPEAMELMFVQVRQQNTTYKVPNMDAALSYDRWTQVLQKDNFTEDILSNVYADQPGYRALYEVPMTLLLARRGMRCFDCKYYVQQNVDLPRHWVRQCRSAYLHYINNGQFELREARYTCEFDPATVLPVMVNVSDVEHVAQGQTAGGWENGRLGLEE